MKTDQICDHHSARKVGLSLRLLEEEGGGEPTTVLIEGPADALRMLAELLVAVAEQKENDGFSISPFGAGRIHFSPASKLGVCIKRSDE